MQNIVNSYHNLVRADIFQLVPQRSEMLLDVGGGIGATGAAIKERGWTKRTVLIDLVADTVAKGVDAAYVANLDDATIIDDVVEREGQFDVILCLDVLEHLRDPWTMVSHLHQALRKNGVLVVSLPNVGHHSVIIPLITSGRFRLADAGIKDRTHLRWFGRDDAVDLITSSGLSLERVEPNFWNPTTRRFAKILGNFGARFTAQQYLISAKRGS